MRTVRGTAIGRDVRIEKDRDIFARLDQWAITTKVDVTFEETEIGHHTFLPYESERPFAVVRSVSDDLSGLVDGVWVAKTPTQCAQILHLAVRQVASL